MDNIEKYVNIVEMMIDQYDDPIVITMTNTKETICMPNKAVLKLSKANRAMILADLSEINSATPLQ